MKKKCFSRIFSSKVDPFTLNQGRSDQQYHDDIGFVEYFSAAEVLLFCDNHLAVYIYLY